MQYFGKCQTIDEIKQLYKQLAKTNHPDLGGDVEIMKAINNEYSKAIELMLRGGKLSSEDYEKSIKYNELYRQAIENIIPIEGIIIDLVGSWIWVTGNTYPVREQIKKAGYFFAGKKQAWYFRSEEYKFKGTGESLDLDEIKNKYGSERIKGVSRKNTINQ